MVSATYRAEAKDPLATLTLGSSKSTSSTTSFARQLASELKERSAEAEAAGRNTADRQNLGAARPATSNPILPAKNPAASSSSTSTETPESEIPTMLGMGPVPGTAPVQYVANPQPVASAPVSEGDAYWAAQPPAVQALRNMPDGEAKNELALKLANQGYSIDTQIMVWGWDPQMTMTVRENQGYSWVPSYGQANISVGPGLSMPDDPNTYSPGNPPAGAIQVSTAFAVGTIQNPLVQTANS
jgi:hypothetical protein